MTGSLRSCRPHPGLARGPAHSPGESQARPGPLLWGLCRRQAHAPPSGACWPGPWPRTPASAATQPSALSIRSPQSPLPTPVHATACGRPGQRGSRLHVSLLLTPATQDNPKGHTATVICLPSERATRTPGHSAQPVTIREQTPGSDKPSLHLSPDRGLPASRRAVRDRRRTPRCSEVAGEFGQRIWSAAKEKAGSIYIPVFGKFQLNLYIFFPSVLW